MHVSCRAELKTQKWRKVLTTSIIREIFKSTGGVSAGACDGERLDTVNPLDNRSTHHGNERFITRPCARWNPGHRRSSLVQALLCWDPGPFRKWCPICRQQKSSHPRSRTRQDRRRRQIPRSSSHRRYSFWLRPVHVVLGW